MKRGILPVSVMALIGFATMGCGGVPDDDAMRLLGASGSQPQASINLAAPGDHLYFGVTNHLHLDGDVLAKVDLNAGSQIELEVATADSSPLRFELWQVHAGTPAWVELLNAFDTDSGFVLTSFYAPSDNTFVVHFPATPVPRNVNVQMDCDRSVGRCTSALQPGEVCYAATACSAGLACAPTDGACNPIWWGGTCVVPGDETACAGLPSAPVCGCDGTTYENECVAVASGSGMKSSGACRGSAPPE
jgi:Kazal-type serine protease inhibitor domain